FYLEDESNQISEDGHRTNERNAWIDTGVIAFLPDAAGTLRELSRSTLKCCTKSGLAELYEEQKMAAKRQKLDSFDGALNKPADTPSLEAFARSTAPKICLYGDMLHALCTLSTAATKCEDDPGTTVMGSLSEKLGKLDLYTCTIPSGSFVHLGTTCELLDFLTLGATGVADHNINAINEANGGSHLQRYQSFGRSMSLTRRSDSFVSGFAPEHTKESIVLNSVIISKSCKNSIIGKGSVIEHCQIVSGSGIRIGERCLLSGIRGSVKGSSFHVPSGMCLQILPLCQSMKSTETTLDGVMEVPRSFACLCLGVEDDIKNAPPKTLFGLEFGDVLQRSGLTEDDLWDASIPSSKRMLWNAKIIPVLSSNDGKMEFDCSLLDWLNCLKGSDGPLTHAAMIGLKKWRESCLSLSEIRQRVNSVAESSYRSSVSSNGSREKRLAEFSDILIGRRHEPCNFDFILDFVAASFCVEGARVCLNVIKEVLAALDNVALSALSKGHLDVVGRTMMTMSFLLSDVLDSCKRCTNFEESMGSGGDRFSEDSMTEIITGLLHSRIPPEVAVGSIFSMRNELIASDDGAFYPRLVQECCDFLERASSAFLEQCVSGKPSILARTSPISIGTTATSSAPARIDLSGGWSDTPPISFEFGGAVACLAVLVDGKRPLRAQCRMVKGSLGIKLRTESRNLSDETLVHSAETAIRTLGDMADFRNPFAECALLKCALIQLGLVPLDSIVEGDGSSIQPHLKKFCQTDLDDVGLEITSQSLLPTGSGMGSSSILGGCIIAAIAKCVGIALTGMGETPMMEVNDSSSLIHAVLMLEQLLTTGGGWQDNIGGLIGGLKLGTSDAGVLPLQTKVQRFQLPPTLIRELNQRIILAFSGKPRLAKDILRNVLRRWARRNNEIMGTVGGLVNGASEAISKFQEGDLDGLGDCMNHYWQSKIAMAGAESGVEPKFVKSLLELLSSRGDIVGGTLCGAGGGGFVSMLATKGKTSKNIEAAVEKTVLDGNKLGLDCFSWHSCAVSEDGVKVSCLE
ncbi:hypothetical protein ACHAXR_006603, partial [Thalassiosira sp. AJA248-18]